MIVRLGLALVVGLGLTVGGYQGARGLEASAQEQVMQLQARHVHEVGAFRVGDLEQALRETAVFVMEREVNLMNFEPRLRVAYDKNPAFRAVAWLPVVKNPEADEFLAQVRRTIPDFAFREMDPETGEIGPAGTALAYVPFLLMWPEHGNTELMGVDLGNQPHLAEAMQQTYRIDHVAAASASVLPPDDGRSFLMLHYVRSPEGFIGGILRVEDLLAHVMEGAPEGFAGRILDHTGGSEVLATQPGFVESDAVVGGSFVLGGRRMMFELAPTAAYDPLGLQLAEAVGFGGAGVTFVLLALALLGAPAKES